MNTKTPGVKVVGYECSFPESAKDFFDFFTKHMNERFLHHQLTDQLIESIKTEGLQLLSIANGIYRLGCRRNFWTVVVFRDPHDPSGIKIDPRPEVLVGRDVEIYEHEQGGVIAKTGEHFVRADSVLEALAGLGRVIEARDAPLHKSVGSFDLCPCGTDRDTHD
jgi:hypothetical protein